MIGATRKAAFYESRTVPQRQCKKTRAQTATQRFTMLHVLLVAIRVIENWLLLKRGKCKASLRPCQAGEFVSPHQKKGTALNLKNLMIILTGISRRQDISDSAEVWVL